MDTWYISTKERTRLGVFQLGLILDIVIHCMVGNADTDCISPKPSLNIMNNLSNNTRFKTTKLPYEPKNVNTFKDHP